MSSGGGPGAGSPFIAGAPTPGGEYHDPYNNNDGTFDATGFFDISSNSPDTLQSLEAIAGPGGDRKTFLSPQELEVNQNNGPDSDSPSDSYQDSSSESVASWKRNGSSASSKTPAATGDTTMDDGDDVKMQWDGANFGGFDGADNEFMFGGAEQVGAKASTQVDPSFDFSTHDDSFMDQSFDFESAASSPKPMFTSGGQPQSAALPGSMAAAKLSNSAGKTARQSTAKNGPPRTKAKVPTKHKKQPSAQSAASTATKPTESREVSPISNLVASYDSSPAAMFNNSPSPHTNLDARMMNGNDAWANQSTHPDGVPQPSQNMQQQMMAAMSMPQQMPFFNQPSFDGRYELTIMPTPLKSRVETQIHITLVLNALPPGVTKLHLPRHTISKPKLITRPAPTKSSDTLEMHVALVCTSAIRRADLRDRALKRATQTPQGYLVDRDDEENSPRNGGDVRICQGCITRERKRAGRKKTKKPDEERMWEMDEERRVVVFNTHEVKQWKPLGNDIDPADLPAGITPSHLHVSAPMRIACYCRHHGEKLGFNVIFTIKDWQDRIFAQIMSEPIMITDDHKTQPVGGAPSTSAAVTTSTNQTPMPSMAPSPASNSAPTPQPTSLPNGLPRAPPQRLDFVAMPQSSQPFFPDNSSAPTPQQAGSIRTMSRSASPSPGGPLAKKRKSSSSRVLNELAMTRMDTSPPASTQQPNGHLSAATSPFSTGTANFSQPDAMFGPPQPFGNEPPTPGDQQPFFGNNRSTSLDNLAMAQLYSAPVSNHGSRAASPSGLRNNLNVPPGQHQFAQALASSLYSLPMNASQQSPNPPVIHKIIPCEGPKIGGIEVTVLGGSFFQGLEVWFGDRKATTTTFWGESSLVCLLPPSPVTGSVPVTFQRQGATTPNNFNLANQPPMFKYVDDSEEKLIRTALSVLAHKMSGNMFDIRDIARSILDGPGGPWAGGSSQGEGPSNGNNGQGFQSRGHEHLEPQLLKVLDLIDLDDSPHRTRLDLKSPAGHTMLHLACSLGFHRFVAGLLARGANPDARDKGGFTPLHLAAINDHPEIVRRLMLVGADPTMRTLSGLTAADVAQSRSVLRAIEKSERHVRRHSRSSLHSRTSSAASLRSLWEPLARANTHDEPINRIVASDEESPEYTSGDFDDEDPDEDNHLYMRRRNRFTPDESSDTDTPPQNRAATAFKDQFQQQLHHFQQALALQFQNFPHLPQIPQMPQMPQMPTLPGIPVLPDYQAYLQHAPFMRRVQQFMPGMSNRNDSDGGTSSPPKVDTRWWDLSAYMQPGTTSASPPPAYEDIFPRKGGRGGSDEKQASAVQAAAEAEADMKCATLYDQTEGSEVSTQRSASPASTLSKGKSPIPDVLKIGRKNAITKEQQEHFLRAREEKMKRLGSDRKLFFIWIPLLIVMVCAMLYSYFPSLLPFAVSFVQATGETALAKVQGLRERLTLQRQRVVEL